MLCKLSEGKMIELTGINLCERRKELNLKINDAVKNNTDFNKIKLGIEKSDVDKLYKIGVASKYKNVEYIIEIFKSGDSLYISHALKCTWIYSDEYSHIINPEYLHENVFPLMSSKMIKKLLTTISVYVKDTRAVNFYNYCVKWNYRNIAKKFLIFTPEAFKLELLKDEKLLNDLKESHEYLTQYLGDSVILAEAYYYTVSSDKRAHTLYEIRHFYFKSNLKYLDMLRKCNSPLNKNLNRLGLRISKDIMKKHKDEIYKNPLIYLYMLNKRMLVQYSTVADAKFYAKSLIVYECPKPYDFWYKDFCKEYKYILDKIPFIERFKFIKEMFTVQYPMEEFEMSKQFYNSQLHKLMSPEEREKWALAHVASGLELLGSGKDFLWYEFISFDKTLVAMKKYILVAFDVLTRIEIIETLVKSAKTDSELETLFDYYYKMHISENQYIKEYFIVTVIKEHNVYKFSESCWEKFNQILHSLKIYNVSNNTSIYFQKKSNYLEVALMYHIIHRKEVPEALTNYIDSEISYSDYFKINTHKLTCTEKALVYQYLLQFYSDKIKYFVTQEYNEEIMVSLIKYIDYVANLFYIFNKTEDDIPEIAQQCMKLISEKIKVTVESSVQQVDLIRYIKKDKDIIVSKFTFLKDMLNSNLKLNTLLKILRTYFPNDLAPMLLKLFQQILTDLSIFTSLCTIKKAVYGVFQLADMDFIKEFLSKYAPTEPKIDHVNINTNVFNIQKSICQLACHSRFPIPLSDIRKYMKGDYVQFCSPLFNYYLAKLPKLLCIEFVHSLIDSPLLLQKHGFRMAFKCFNEDDLRKTIIESWFKTKNVSLRYIIYVSLYKKIKDVDELIQNKFFAVLILFTISLHEEDNVDVFRLIASDELPNRFIGKYIETVWNTVCLPEKKDFLQHAIKVINCMERNIYLMRKEIIESIIEDHVNDRLKQERVKISYYANYHERLLVKSKWDLFHSYVTFFTDEDNYKKKVEIVLNIIIKSIILWNEVVNEKYIMQVFVPTFIKAMNEKSFTHDVGNYTKTNKLFEQILQKLRDFLCLEDIYEINWYIRVSNITRNILFDVEQNSSVCDRWTKFSKAVDAFGKEFSNLFIENVENGQCYVTFFDIIEDIVMMNMDSLLTHFKYDGDSKNHMKAAMSVELCSKIVEYTKFETYMFASKLLPCKFNNCLMLELYRNVFNKLKSYKNDEIQCYLHVKFVTNNINNIDLTL